MLVRKLCQDCRAAPLLRFLSDTYSHVIPGSGNQVTDAMEDLLTYRVGVKLVSKSVRRDMAKTNCSTILPANLHIFGVEPRGFEPLTSAVQSQTSMCRRLP